jgi:hypothetical protein
MKTVRHPIHFYGKELILDPDGVKRKLSRDKLFPVMAHYFDEVQNLVGFFFILTDHNVRISCFKKPPVVEFCDVKFASIKASSNIENLHAEQWRLSFHSGLP